MPRAFGSCVKSEDSDIAKYGGCPSFTLCSAQKESGGKEQRCPISKKRNKHLQTVLIEAAKLAPRWNEQLAEIHAKELTRGNRNRATLAVARRLVAYMMAVERRETAFEHMTTTIAA